MWKKVVKETVLEPLFRRLGTLGAGALVFGGDYLCEHFQACGLVNENGAQLAMTWLVAAALVVFDLAVSAIDRAKVERKAINRVLGDNGIGL